MFCSVISCFSAKSPAQHCCPLHSSWYQILYRTEGTWH